MRRSVITAFLVVSALVAVTLSVAAGERPAEHMEVEATATCDGCHAETTPEIHAQWYGSKHGLLNVKCFVCHGAIGEEFSLEPAAERCIGCHFEEVESLASPALAGKSCFSCHPPHQLAPHADSAAQGGNR